ncbi:MAG: TorF family putative porin [Acidobacteriota bacterium]
MCCLVLASSLVASSASAQQISAWQAEVGAASDYIFRGFSRSDGEPALQVGLRYLHRSGFFAGGWASTVRFDYDGDFADDTRRFELQAFAGYSTSFGPDWSGSAQVVRYLYPDTDPAVDRSYGEASLTLFFRDLLSVAVAYTPGFLRSNRSGTFFELSGRYPLPRSFELSAGLGRGEVDLGAVDGFTYGHLAVSRPIGRPAARFHVDLGYYHSDAPEFPRWGAAIDGNWALVVSKQFR